MRHLLLLSFFLCLATKCVGVKKPTGEDYSEICTIEKLVKTEVGSTLRLKGFVDIGEWCYFVFKQTDNNYECCYGHKDKRNCERSNIHKNRNETRCLAKKEFSVKARETDKSTECVLQIKSVSKSATGHYIVYSNDDEKIQDCQVSIDKKD